MKKVVIVGGGFAGIKAAKILSREKSLEIFLIDQSNYHLFQPLLYQVATAALAPANIATPIRSLFSKPHNVTVLEETVTSVDLSTNKVLTSSSEIPYDLLVMGCGAQHSYFGHDEWEKFAPGLKSIKDALNIRDHILECYERAEKICDVEKQKKLLTFVIVGGGPTGVELAGAIAEMSHSILTKDFRHIDSSKVHVILIEALPRILPPFSEKSSERALRDLQSLGVDVKVSTTVTDITEKIVTIGNEKIEAETILWTAGVKATELNTTLHMECDHQGKVIVLPDLTLPGHPNVFVMGDQAHCNDEEGKPLPGVAAVAIQEGHYVGQTILNDLKGRPRQPFKCRVKGNAATIGKNKAIVEFGHLHFSGFVAWLIWLFIHIFYLTGIQNRILVLIQWAGAYFWQRRGARLIVSRK